MPGLPKDEWALARFDGQPLYEHPTPGAASTWTGAPSSSTSGSRRCATFVSSQRALLARGFHVDGLRSTLSRAFSISTTRAKRRMAPNSTGGRENLEAISFLQEVNATAYKREPGILMIAEDSTCTRVPDQPLPTGLGCRPQMNMGCMNDTLATWPKTPCTGPTTTTSSPSAWLPSARTHAADQPESRARQGITHREDARRPWQKPPTCAPISLHWSHPGSSCSFWSEVRHQRV